MDFSLNQRDIMTTVDNTSDATSDAGALWFNLLSKPAKTAENMRNSRKSKEKISLMYIWQRHIIIMAMF